MMLKKKTHCFYCNDGELVRLDTEKNDVCFVDRCTHCRAAKFTVINTGYVEYHFPNGDVKCL